MSDNKREKEQIYKLDLETLEFKLCEPEVSQNESPVIKHSNIKRMLSTLDKFLATKFSLILGLCIFAITSCSIALLVNNTNIINAASSSSSGKGNPNIALNTWLWSILALFAFLMVLSIIYTIARARSKKSSKN